MSVKQFPGIDEQTLTTLLHLSPSRSIRDSLVSGDRSLPRSTRGWEWFPGSTFFASVGQWIDHLASNQEQ